MPKVNGGQGPQALPLILRMSLSESPIKLLLSTDYRNLLQTWPTLTSEHNVVV